MIAVNFLAPIKIEIVQEQARVPVTIFRLADRINLGNAEHLEEKAREAFANGVRYLLIDLTNVPSITSAGLRTLQIIYKLFETGVSSGISRRSTCLKLLNPTPELRRMLSLSGFDLFFDIYDNQQEALLSF
jgi:anti-anti-sigma factor